MIKTDEDIHAMKKAGALVAACHREVASLIRPGWTTLQINDFVEAMIIGLGGRPVLKGFNGYPFAICASVNDVIAHGLPNSAPLREGDMVKIDICADVDGWKADSAWCYAVGTISSEAARLMQVTRECLERAIAAARPGKSWDEVMVQAQKHAENHGYSMLPELGGHGIGRSLHEELTLNEDGATGPSLVLKEGMVLTIEPIVNQGSRLMVIEEDGWTVRTLDRKLSCQFEHTVAITKDGAVVLTQSS